MRFPRSKKPVFLVFALLIFLLLSASSAKADEAKREKLFFSIYGSLYPGVEGVVCGFGGSVEFAFEEKVALEVEFNGTFGDGSGFLLVGGFVFNMPTDGGAFIPYLAGGLSHCFLGEGISFLKAGGGVKLKMNESKWFRLDMTFFFAGRYGGYVPRLSAGVMWAF